MEFYELNRLYDYNLPHYSISKIIDHYLYVFIPLIILLGLTFSILDIITLSRPYFKSTSKNYLLSQSIFNFLFQILTAIIFITNYYEKQIIYNIYFKNNRVTFYKIKILIHIIYNFFLYCLIWLFVLAALDYCFISIIKFHFNLNYDRENRKLFHKQQAQFNQQQRLINQQNSRLKNKQNLQVLNSPNVQQKLTSICSSLTSMYPSGVIEQESFATDTINNTNNNNNNNNNNNTYSNISQNAQNLFENRTNINSTDVIEDDTNLYELDFNENGSKRKRKKKIKKKIDVIFFSEKLIRFTIFLVIFLSIILAIPQWYGSEVKQNYLTISPLPMPLNSESDIYFIERDILEKKSIKKLNQNKNTNEDLFYSKSASKALGFSFRINQTKENLDIINTMRQTHSKFFTSSGFFNLASKRYELCNLVKNSKEVPIIKRPDVIANDNLNNLTNVTVNVSLICVKKGDLNNHLTYNTLYFWLEHTMVISAPIFIILVVFGTLVYNFVNYSKLMKQQNRIREKRKKLIKIQQQNSLTRSYNLNNSQKHATKVVQIKDNEHYIDVINPIVDCIPFKIIDIDKENHNSKEILDKQNEDQNLDMMFIIDLAFYIFISFPYTMLRLILDLFSKEKNKINLDFFILYKLAFLMFHLHLISKFFIMLIFNSKFRFSLTRAFTLYGKINQENETENLVRFNSKLKHEKNSKLKLIFCFCCMHCCLSRFFVSNSKSQSSLNDYNQTNGINYDLNECRDRSTEFNSNLHQYKCPADPDLDSSFQFTPKKTNEKFNLVENIA